jgi:hypothetical protein
MRCEPCEAMSEFERFLFHQDTLVRGTAATMLVKVAPEKVMLAALETSTLADLHLMLLAIDEAGHREIEDLTPLLRLEDSMMVERALQSFIRVGRADLLFGMAVSGDEKTTQRIKRYLHEQGFLK